MGDFPIGCAICAHNYSEKCIPKVLPCGHTFCLACLTRIIADGGSCPNDRKPIAVTAEDLPTNFGLLEVAIALGRTTSSTRVKSDEKKGSMCSLHEKEFSRYCYTCTVSICADCRDSVNHRRHDVGLISEILEEVRGKIEVRASKVSEGLASVMNRQKSLREARQHLWEDEADANKLIASTREELKNFVLEAEAQFRGLAENLIHRRKVFYDDLEEKSKRDWEALSTQQEMTDAAAELDDEAFMNNVQKTTEFLESELPKIDKTLETDAEISGKRILVVKPVAATLDLKRALLSVLRISIVEDEPDEFGEQSKR